MTMKKAELEKQKGLQIANAQRHGGNRYGPASAPPADRRAQRELDRAAGLVPFAVKLPAELVRQLNDAAQQRGVAINDLVAELLRAQLKG